MNSYSSKLLLSLISLLVLNLFGCASNPTREEDTYLRGRMEQINRLYTERFIDEKKPILSMSNSNSKRYDFINPIIDHSSDLDKYDNNIDNDTLFTASSVFENNYKESFNYDETIESYIESKYDVDNYKFVIVREYEIIIELDNPNYDITLVKYDNSLTSYYGSVSLIGNKTIDGDKTTIAINNASAGHYIFYVYPKNGDYSSLDPYKVHIKANYLESSFDFDSHALNNDAGIIVWNSDFEMECYNFGLDDKSYYVGTLNKKKTKYITNEYIQKLFIDKTKPFRENIIAAEINYRNIFVYDNFQIESLNGIAKKIHNACNREAEPLLFFSEIKLEDNAYKYYLYFKAGKYMLTKYICDGVELDYSHLIIHSYIKDVCGKDYRNQILSLFTHFGYLRTRDENNIVIAVKIKPQTQVLSIIDDEMYIHNKLFNSYYDVEYVYNPSGIESDRVIAEYDSIASYDNNDLFSYGKYAYAQTIEEAAKLLGINL